MPVHRDHLLFFEVRRLACDDKFIQYNYVVTVCGLLVLLTVLAVKKLSDKFLVFLNRRVLAAGTLVFVS